MTAAIYLTLTICFATTGQCHELTIPQPFESHQQCQRATTDGHRRR